MFNYHTDEYAHYHRGIILREIADYHRIRMENISNELIRRQDKNWNNLNKKQKETHAYYEKGEPVPVALLNEQLSQSQANIQWAQMELAHAATKICETLSKVVQRAEEFKKAKATQDFSDATMEANILRGWAVTLDLETTKKHIGLV